MCVRHFIAHITGLAMDDPRVQAQAAAKMQAEELHTYMKELFGWQEELKRKEKGLKERSSAEAPLPPVRGRVAAPEAGPAAPAGAAGGSAPAAAASAGARPAQRHPAAHTYEHYRDKWEKFDVDAALASDDEDAPPSGTRTAAPASAAPSSSSSGGTPAAAATAAAQPPGGSAPLPAARIRAAAQAAAARQAQPTPPTAAEGWKDEGNRHFKAGAFQKAIDSYTASLALAPSCLAHANRAMAHLKLRQYADAERDCTAALALDPAYVKAYQRRASARQELGDLLGAIDDQEAALRLEPGNKATAAERRQCVARLLEQQGLDWEPQRERVPVVAAAAASASASSGLAPLPAGALASAAAGAGPLGALAPPAAYSNGEVLLAAASSRKLKPGEQGSSGAMRVAIVQPVAAAPTAAAPAAAVAPRPAAAAAAEVATSSAAVPMEIDSTVVVVPVTPQVSAAAAAPAATAAAVQPAPAIKSAPAPAAAGAGPGAAGTGATAAGAAPAGVAAAVAGALRHVAPAGALKAPRTGLEFERGWKACKCDLGQQAAYLDRIPPAKLPAILKQALTPGLLAALLRALLHSAAQHGGAAHAAALLEALPGVARFDMNLLSLPARDKAGLSEAWNQAAAALAGREGGGEALAGRLAAVRQKFKL